MKEQYKIIYWNSSQGCAYLEDVEKQLEQLCNDGFIILFQSGSGNRNDKTFLWTLKRELSQRDVTSVSSD